jgi:hypothetical protein
VRSATARRGHGLALDGSELVTQLGHAQLAARAVVALVEFGQALGPSRRMSAWDGAARWVGMRSVTRPGCKRALSAAAPYPARAKSLGEQPATRENAVLNALAD